MVNRFYTAQADSAGQWRVPPEYACGVTQAKDSRGYVKKVAAMANRDLGVLDSTIAEAIIFGCDRLIAGELHRESVTDFIQGGAGTSVNTNANEVIANVTLDERRLLTPGRCDEIFTFENLIRPEFTL